MIIQARAIFDGGDQLVKVDLSKAVQVVQSKDGSEHGSILFSPYYHSVFPVKPVVIKVNVSDVLPFLNPDDWCKAEERLINSSVYIYFRTSDVYTFCTYPEEGEGPQLKIWGAFGMAVVKDEEGLRNILEKEFDARENRIS